MSDAFEKKREEKRDVNIARAMQDLLRSDGWKEYEKQLLHHIGEETTRALMPVLPATATDGITQVLRGESAKGAIMGLRLALGIPRGIIAMYPALSAEDDD